MMKNIIGIRGETGMKCPICNKDMKDVSPLMMGPHWKCEDCKKKYMIRDAKKNIMYDFSKIKVVV